MQYVKLYCSASKVDAPNDELASLRSNVNQLSLTDDVSACHLETEHVHKVYMSYTMSTVSYMYLLLTCFIGEVFLFCGNFVLIMS